MSTFKTAVVLAGLACCSQGAWGEIANIEDQLLVATSDGLRGNLTGGISGSDGNTDSLILSVSGKLGYKKGVNDFFLYAQEVYQEIESTAIADKTLVHGRYTRSVNNKLAGELYSQWERDDIILLKSRFIHGAGLRYNWLTEENKWISHFGLGAYYFDEDHEEPVVTGTTIEFEEVDDDGVRFNAYATLTWKVNDQVTLHDTLYYQPLVDDFDDYRLLNTFNLAV
ncbi:MAG: DUF481 domain-containing protein, partial [Verrucomicrobiota bacterium]